MFIYLNVATRYFGWSQSNYREVCQVSDWIGLTCYSLQVSFKWVQVKFQIEFRTGVSLLWISSVCLANCVADAEYMVRQVVTNLGWVVIGQKVAADVALNSAKFKSTKPRSMTTCLTVSTCIVHSLARRLRHRQHRRDGGVGNGDGTCSKMHVIIWSTTLPIKHIVFWIHKVGYHFKIPCILCGRQVYLLISNPNTNQAHYCLDWPRMRWSKSPKICGRYMYMAPFFTTKAWNVSGSTGRVKMGYARPGEGCY